MSQPITPLYIVTISMLSVPPALAALSSFLAKSILIVSSSSAWRISTGQDISLIHLSDLDSMLAFLSCFLSCRNVPIDFDNFPLLAKTTSKTSSPRLLKEDSRIRVSMLGLSSFSIVSSATALQALAAPRECPQTRNCSLSLSCSLIQQIATIASSTTVSSVTLNFYKSPKPM